MPSPTAGADLVVVELSLNAQVVDVAWLPLNPLVCFTG